MQECGKWKIKNNPSPQPEKMQEQSLITGKGAGGGDSEAVPLNISYCLDPQGRVLCAPHNPSISAPPAGAVQWGGGS